MKKDNIKLTRRLFLRNSLFLSGGSILHTGGILPLTAKSQINNWQEKTILIKNALIVNADRQAAGDILIRGEKIAAIGKRLGAKSDITEVIDAAGLQVLPGGVDPHVHITGPFADDFTSGSQAALAGGITTIGNLSWPGPDQSLDALLDEHTKLIKSAAIADVMLHPTVNNPTSDVIEVLPVLAKKGYTSFKIFMAMDNFNDHMAGYLQVLQKAKETGMLPMIHCEDQPMLTSATQKLLAEGKESIQYYPQSRPQEAEAAATQWAVDICEKMGIPVYIVHLSSEIALTICAKAQKKKLPVYVETRPIYLHLTAENFLRDDASLFVGMPPLREKNDQEALWRGVTNGSVHVLATDHAPWTKQQKLIANTIRNFRAGVCNLQEMLPMFYSEGVKKGKISLQQFVRLTSSNAASLFGLYPRKGVIAPGSDADLVIWDPQETYTIKSADGYSKAGFSIYEGWKITGRPKITFRRGEIVYRNNQITASPGSGQLLKRGKGILL